MEKHWDDRETTQVSKAVPLSPAHSTRVASNASRCVHYLHLHIRKSLSNLCEVTQLESDSRDLSWEPTLELTGIPQTCWKSQRILSRILFLIKLSSDTWKCPSFNFRGRIRPVPERMQLWKLAQLRRCRGAWKHPDGAEGRFLAKPSRRSHHSFLELLPEQQIQWTESPLVVGLRLQNINYISYQLTLLKQCWVHETTLEM